MFFSKKKLKKFHLKKRQLWFTTINFCLKFSDYASYNNNHRNDFNYVRANSPSLFLAPARPNPSPTYPPLTLRPLPPPPTQSDPQPVQSLAATSGYNSTFQVKSFLTEDELKNKYYQYWADQQVSYVKFYISFLFIYSSW